MALLVRKVSDLEDLNLLLRGGVVAGCDLLTRQTFNLDGKTLITTSPVATVTFDTNPEGAQQPLTLAQIIAQIEANVTLAGYAKVYKSRLKLEDPTGGTAVTIGNGTANSILGLKDGQTGVIYAAPGNAAPALVDINPLQQGSGGYLVTTDEA